jgi:hypothetical protein
MHFVWPFTGREIFQSDILSSIDRWFVGMASSQFGAASLAWPRLTETLLILVLASWFLLLLWRNRKDRLRHLIVLSFVVVTVLSTLLSLKMASAPRYAFAPSVMLVVLALGDVGAGAVGWRRKLPALAFLLVLVVFGFSEYRTSSLLSNIYWPVWREEVRIWRQYPWYRIAIWPQFRSSNWSIELRQDRKQ